MGETESPHRVGLNLSVTQTNLILHPLGRTVNQLEEISTGFNNKIYVVKTNEESSLVIKISKFSWPAHKVECEVSALKLISQRTSIPVPKVLLWNSEGSSEIGCRYIIMELITGQNLHDQWPHFTQEEKRCVIHQIIDVMVQLQSMRFNEIGGIREGVVVPYFPLSKGPFPSLFQWYKALLNNAIEQQKQNPKLKSISVFNERVIGLLDDIEKNHLSKLEDIPIVMFHGDFSFRNFLVDNTRLTGIVDWEFSGAFPVDIDWYNGWDIMRDGSEEDKNLIKAEIDKTALITPWKGIKFFENRKLLFELLDNLSPWVVGLFGEEEDIEYVKESEEILTQNISKLSIPNAWEIKSQYNAI